MDKTGHGLPLLSPEFEKVFKIRHGDAPLPAETVSNQLAALDPSPDRLLRDLADRGDLPDSVQRVDGSGIQPIRRHKPFLDFAVSIRNVP